MTGILLDHKWTDYEEGSVRCRGRTNQYKRRYRGW